MADSKLFARRSSRTADSRMPLRERSESLAGNLPPLLVAAERIAATVQQGVHGRRQVGMGEAFWQYRRYEIGDSPGMIDWRQSGRTDSIFVKENEWDAAQSVWLWRDRSPSMEWASSDALDLKRDRADLLAMAATVLLVRAGERVALPEMGARPLTGRTAINRAADTLVRLREEDRKSIAELQESAADAPPDSPAIKTLPRHATLIWISDFLSPVADIAQQIRAIAAQGVRGIMVQILDPAEEDLPYSGRVRFNGVEGEQPLILSRVDAVRAAYRTRMSARNQTLADEARRVGWRVILHRTDSPAQVPLLSIHAAVSGEPLPQQKDESSPLSSSQTEVR